MITVDEAFKLVGENFRPLPPMKAPLAEVLGLRLAEPITSDIDSPPFDKSMLDGFAVIASDTSSTRRIIEQVIAGGVPTKTVVSDTATLVMTGAPIPVGADAVIKHEDTQRIDESTVKLPNESIKSGAGIFRRGQSFHVGQEVLPANKELRPVDIALLAEVGRAEVNVIARPRVAVLATGNELVEPGESLAPGQIRNSNGPMLMAAVDELGATPVSLGTARDDHAELRAAITRGLENDVLLITGGVSAGVMDLVPSILKELGVEQVFHKVRMKPGKPLWFGVRDKDGRRTLVFGLPGNPVSTLVSFQLFVKPAIRALGGGEFSAASPVRGQLTDSIKHRGDRPTYYPCRLEAGAQGPETIEPLAWRGSADLAALTRANGLLLLPAGDYELAVGTPVDALTL
jgi:molybdopterin molybdotransferase